MRSLPMTFCSSLMTTAWSLSSFSRSCCWPRNLFRHCFHTCTTVTVTALCHLLGDRGRITKQPSQQLSAFCFTYSSNHYSNHLQWLVRCNSQFNQSHMHARTHARTHTHTHTRLTALCPGLPEWARTRKVTRSSATAEGPRDTSCQLKYCQLPHNSAETTYTTSPDQIDGMKLEI